MPPMPSGWLGGIRTQSLGFLTDIGITQESARIPKHRIINLVLTLQRNAIFIKSPDLAVVFTDTVSHKMLNGLNQRASKLDFPVAICHSSSCSALKNVLEKYCANEGVANA